MDPTSSTLGAGTYGMVKRSGNTAVKHFSKLSHLIQECAAGTYLNECPYTVNVIGFDLENLTMTMELYDGSLKDWISEPRSFKQKLIMFRQILKGLVYLHDLGLVHGDLKPGNCVARWDENGDLQKVVIADLGFVAPEGFAKAERTAPVYRELNVERDYRHDIYSLGVIGLEAFGDVKVTRQFSSKKLIHNVKKFVDNSDMRRLLISMLNEDRAARPTARYILKKMFDLQPEIQYHPGVPYLNIRNLNSEDEALLEKLFRHYSSGENEIRRTKIGYNICRVFLDKRGIPGNQHKKYVAAMLIILSAIFGKSRFYMKQATALAGCSSESIYRTLYSLLNDDQVLNYLFFTKSSCLRGYSAN